MSYGLLTGDDFNWTTNVPFPHGRGYTEPFFTIFPDKEMPQLKHRPVVCCSVAIEIVTSAVRVDVALTLAKEAKFVFV